MVYVDNMYEIPLGEFKRGNRTYKISHVIADSQEELLSMMDKIGVERRYIQHKGTLGEHFDITMSKRELAIAAGARAIHWRDYAAMIEKRCLDNGVHWATAKITACNTKYKVLNNTPQSEIWPYSL